MQNPTHEDRERDAALNRYLDALDSGDLDALDAVLARAETDAELARLIQSVNRATYAEAELVPLAESGQTVRRLLSTHMPSAVFTLQEDAPQPLTVGDVAARIEERRTAGTAGAVGALMTAADLEANHGLRASSLRLPQGLTAAAVRDLLSRLGVQVSERYGRLFRETALALGMGRQHTVALAAARRAGRGRAAPKAGAGATLTPSGQPEHGGAASPHQPPQASQGQE